MPTDKHSSTAQGPGALEQRTGTASGAMDKRTAETSQYTFQQQLDQLDERRKMIEAKAQGKDSFGHQLLQPKNILGMALAAAGMASGNNDLIAGGAGLGMGGIQGMTGAVDQNNMDRQKQIDSLTKMVDTQQQRLVTLLQTQPGLFTDDAGQDTISQEEWIDILPLGVPFSPAALMRRKAAGGKDPRGAAADLLLSKGITSKNPTMRKAGLHLFSEANGLDWTDEIVDAIDSGTGTDPQEFINVMLKDHTAISVMELMQTAQRNNVPVYDPSLDHILRRSTPGPETMEEQEVFDAKEQLREWLKLDDHLAMWENNPYDALEEAFAGEPDKLATLQDNSAFFNRGTRADELRLRTESEMWRDSNSLMLMREGGFALGGEERRKLMARMSKELDAVFNTGRDVVTIHKGKRSAKVMGAAYVKMHGLDPKIADAVGSALVTRRNALMRDNGLNPNTVPLAQSDAYMDAAFKFQEMLAGTGTQEQYEAALAAAVATGD